MADTGLVGEYLTLGLRLGRHIDGLVDAYYGPPERMAQVDTEPMHPPDKLVVEPKALVASINAGEPLDPVASGGSADAGADPARRHWLRSQVVGLHTTARKLAGEEIGYAEEVAACYGGRAKGGDEGGLGA